MARVLVADDDPDTLAGVVSDLQEEHEVLGVADGGAALDALDSFAPDVVVLEHRMPPGPTGLAVATRLRAERPTLPVVLYSDYQDPHLLRRAAELGVRFLPKGNIETLRHAVRR